MKHRIPLPAATALVLGCSIVFAGQVKLPPGGALGHAEVGAASLYGYLVADRPCLPVKRFAADAGYKTNISPSRRNFAVLVGTKTQVVLNMTAAQIDGKKFDLSVPAFERDGDFFVPLEFYEKAFPARFTYDAKKKNVTAVLPGKTLTVPIKPLPPAPPAPAKPK